MNDAQLQAFRDLAEQLHPEPHDWQWIGQYMSQRHFGITRRRAEAYAARHGGIASPMAEAGQSSETAKTLLTTF